MKKEKKVGTDESRSSGLRIIEVEIGGFSLIGVGIPLKRGDVEEDVGDPLEKLDVLLGEEFSRVSHLEQMNRFKFEFMPIEELRDFIEQCEMKIEFEDSICLPNCPGLELARIVLGEAYLKK